MRNLNHSKYRWAVLALLLLGSGGCGRASPDPETKITIHEDVVGENEILAAKKGKLTCDFASECDPSVVMISIAKKGTIARCSGFLVNQNQVLTNSHCVESLPADERSCQGKVFVHFSGDVHRGCRRIPVRSGSSTVYEKDYAVIELDTPITDRKPVKLSTRGFRADESVEIYRVQMSSDDRKLAYNGTQTLIKCSASYGTLMANRLNSAKYPLMTFGDCPIQPGNSGSPIFNTFGEVGGVVQGVLGFTQGETTQRVEREINDHLLDKSYGQVAIGTHTHCMKELMGPSAQECLALPPREEHWPEDYLSRFPNLSEGRLPQLNSPEIVWRSSPRLESFSKSFFVVPACVWVGSLTARGFEADELVFKLGFNRYLQAEWRISGKLGEKTTRFQAQVTPASNARTIDFYSSSVGVITVPTCR